MKSLRNYYSFKKTMSKWKGEIVMKQVTITKEELMALGYGPSQSSDLVRKAKTLMVQKGYSYYNTKKLGRVPVAAVEEILGIILEFDDRVLSDA